MAEAGADAFRLNFSHGSQANHQRVFAAVRAASEELDRPLPVVQDIQGPKIRVGKLAESLTLARGDTVRFVAGEEAGDGIIPITYAHLATDVKVGDRILMDDGYLSAQVTAIEDHATVVAKIVDGGQLRSNKGVNFPGVRLSVRFPTPKDLKDIHFGQRLGVDYLAVSFVRSAADLARVRAELDDDQLTRVIAKVELEEAVINMDEIVRASDGIMVARGDLGVELAPENVPAVQKRLLRACDALGVPSITATQMLESMITNPRPTRAEVTDVFNAVLDGTGAVMLSAETAVGEHASAAIEVMGRICEQAEELALHADDLPLRRQAMTRAEVPDVVTAAAATAAEDLGAAAIIVLTHHGLSARILAKYRPQVPIFAATSLAATYRRLGLIWGVTPLQIDYHEDAWDAIGAVRDHLLGAAHLDPDDDVIVLNARGGKYGATNTMRIAPLRDMGP